jgi:bifunctional DNA-binding transcriptional regulator/antitoxin component of YhaV-PrlF toxin-antitoxin module
MTKLAKQYWINAKGERKVNCYKATIPKELVEKLGLQDREIKVKIIDNKLIIDKQ